MIQLRTAQRQKAKLKIGIAGPSGSGKTYSALQLAAGLAPFEKICIIDTENGSADLYSHLGAFNVITLAAPFSPENYIEAIKAAENAQMEVIIIDSMTHEWSGVGGILETQEKLGGRYSDWGKVKPRHRKFIDTILQSKAHFITTVRSKQDYSMDQVDGKTKIQKLGTKQVTEEGYEYELTLSFELMLNHLARASKDRTGIFMDQPEFIITTATGRKLLEWAESGADIKPAVEVAPTEERPGSTTIKPKDGVKGATIKGPAKKEDEPQKEEEKDPSWISKKIADTDVDGFLKRLDTAEDREQVKALYKEIFDNYEANDNKTRLLKEIKEKNEKLKAAEEAAPKKETKSNTKTAASKTVAA